MALGGGRAIGNIIGRMAGAAAFLALAGCTVAVPPFYTDKRIENPEAIVEATDWELAISLTIDIRQNAFSPTIIRLYQGEPYRMVLENRDDVIHVFEAAEFFRTTAIRKIVTETGEEFPDYIAEVVLQPGAIKEIHFVPMRDGWYEFEGGGSSFAGAGALFWHVKRGAALGMIGRIIVEP